MVRCTELLALAVSLGLSHGQKKHGGGKNGGGSSGKPNVVVIMSDDQDLQLGSSFAQPQIASLIGGEGTTYNKHFCTTAWCCPSRVSFLTGKAAHNTNVTSITPPYGGYPKFLEQGLNGNYLPVWLSGAGVNSYYVGKFMNGYAKENFASPYPDGWTDSSFLVDPWTYNYYGSHWSNQKTQAIEDESGTHTTTVTERKGLEMVDAAVEAGGQFFLMVAPVAPHLQNGGGLTEIPPVPPKYEGKFDGNTVPRSGNFNPDVPSGASWVYDLPQLGAGAIAKGDTIYAHRLGNLAGIDDLVASLIQRLDDHGILDNTYVLYTTDNGFHIGNHRLPPGKRCPYEEDINIPLLIRGPDVAKGASDSFHTHQDVAPTVLQMLGLPLQGDFDGQPIDYATGGGQSEVVTVEFWNGASVPQGVDPGEYGNNTYKALRLVSDQYNVLYSVWCTGEHEYYDMTSDNVQMHNLLSNGVSSHRTGAKLFKRADNKVVDRLDALLMVTKSCAQDSCREPWASLFPDGSVTTLSDALDSKYDSFFAKQPKVEFSSCDQGYIISEEGPQEVTPYGKKH